MPYRIKRFKKEHLDNFDFRDEQKAEAELFLRRDDIIYIWVNLLPMFTLFYNEKPLMVYGMQATGWGTYYPTIFMSKGIDKHILSVIRCVYKYADEYVGQDVRRFEAYVNAEDTKAHRFARFFGMEPVGIRRQAGVSGEDQVVYERLWRK